MRSKARFTTWSSSRAGRYLQIRVQSQNTRTLSTSSKGHLRGRRFIEPSPSRLTEDTTVPALARATSASDQTQKSDCATGKSALPSTAGIVSQTCQVRKVPRPAIKRLWHEPKPDAFSSQRGYHA